MLYLEKKLINGCNGSRNMKWLKVLNCAHKNSY